MRNSGRLAALRGRGAGSALGGFGDFEELEEPSAHATAVLFGGLCFAFKYIISMANTSTTWGGAALLQFRKGMQKGGGGGGEAYDSAHIKS